MSDFLGKGLVMCVLISWVFIFCDDFMKFDKSEVKGLLKFVVMSLIKPFCYSGL